MRQAIVLGFHLLYWVLYGSLCVFLLYLGRGDVHPVLNDNGSVYAIVVLVTAMLAFYPFYTIWFRRYLSRRKIKAFVIAGLLTCAAVSLLVTGLLVIGFYWLVGFVPEATVIIPYLVAFFVYALIHGIVASAIRGFVHWYLELRIREARERKNLETELALLKGQLQPHFLFNTINNIDVLISREPAKASRYLQQLSDILRYILYKSSQPAVTLEEELQFVKQYVGLQKIRKSTPDWVQLELGGSPAGLTIAPLLFLPYIENAFKYGVSGARRNPIVIRFTIQGGVLHFYCMNHFTPGKSDATDGGIGLPMARQRLALLYDGRHHLEVQVVEDTFIVQCQTNL